MPWLLQGLHGGLGSKEVIAAPAGSVPTMEVLQTSGASGEIIHQMDASMLEVHSSPRSSALLAIWVDQLVSVMHTWPLNRRVDMGAYRR